ncbi:MAG: glycosyltransferase [Desulfobacteraceae bacterium]|nr:MAG: glycosyltransferase [Desulfobacteraceae bacterium]
MIKKPLSILQIHTKDLGGGADSIALALLKGLRLKGHHSRIMVGIKKGNDPFIIQIDHERYKNIWSKIWDRIGRCVRPFENKIPGMWRVHELLSYGIGEPGRWLEILQGHEDFQYPATDHILDRPAHKPDILHCHNLHGGYFDLRALPRLSHAAPSVITLHDAWLLSGHCAHSFDCQRWRTGCSVCPDLTIYPPLRRDGAGFNWSRKKSIFKKSRFYIHTPCQWLLRKTEESILKDSIADSKVIPYGIDLSIFKPVEKTALRAALHIPMHAKVILIAANSIRKSIWKDSISMRESIAWVTQNLAQEDLYFIALGDVAPDEQIGLGRIHFVPFQKEAASLAQYYQASDLYVHPARADTFPNAVLEALACGTPVIATAVGGINEQIIDGVTGFLVPAQDAITLSAAMHRLLQDDILRGHYARNAAEDAVKRFDIRMMVDRFIDWYQIILEQDKKIKEGNRAHA